MRTAAQPRRRTGLQKALLASLVVVVLGLGWLGYKVVNHVAHLPPTVGEREFRTANNNLDSSGPAAAGNSESARELAARMSSVMKAMRNALFERSTKTSFLDANDSFRTYCELRDGECVFLVHVPELRRFTSSAKESLGKTAWATAQSLLKESRAGKPGMRVAVGLRGIAAYDRILTGNYVGQYDSNPTDEKTGIKTNSGISSESELYPWFASPTNSTAAP